MSQKIVIVEDQFIEANSLKLLLSKEGYTISGVADSVEKALELIKKDRPDFVLVDIFLKGKLTGIDLAVDLKKMSIPFIYISANSNEEILNLAKATQPDGFVVKPFRKKDVLVTLSIANYRYQHSRKTELTSDNHFEQQLVNIIEGDDTIDNKMSQLAASFQSFIPFDLFTIRNHSASLGDANSHNFLRVAFNEYQLIGLKELTTIVNLSPAELGNLMLYNFTEPSYRNGKDFVKLSGSSSLLTLMHTTFEMKSYLSLPIRLNSGELCYLCFLSKRPDTYSQDHLMAYNRLHTLIYKVIGIIKGKKGAGVVQTGNAAPNFASTNHTDPGKFKGMIGSSHLLLNVFDQISQVASSDTSVLILGESGTGKEKVADAVHNLSQRSGKPIIRVNCAALPATLIESELFGHEKGAFTGANEKRIGKFEQADTGTIFLDEIGEMPIELQVKLLRVLQEKEIERLGSKAPTKLNVRIIAATSRNLEKEVADGRFRLDLYYRLNVFPIVLPSLRERKEDIPELASHFIQLFNRRNNKDVTGISDSCLMKMVEYNWPGNIRELEHVIERSILMAKGSVLDDIPLSIAQKKDDITVLPDEVKIKTIQENERDHILRVLKKCKGKIWGPGAAAEMLNIPASTLKSKMKKLGIQKDYLVG